MPTNKTAVDLVGGTVGGALQAVVGHPLDTIKVRLQNNQTAGQGGLRDVVRSMVREEGMLSLYKGVQAPFFLNGALNAVLFGVNSVSKDIVVAATGRRSHADLGLHHVIVSALLTAPVYCAAVVPVELVKCRLQAQKGGHGSAEASAVLKYKGPLHCATQTVAEEGLAGLWRGYAATVGMRMIGLPAYFAGYEGAKRALMSGQAAQATPATSADRASTGTGRTAGRLNSAAAQPPPPPPPPPPVSTAVTLAAGSMAGIAFWCASFPLDTIKTRLQSQPGGGAGGGGLAAAIAEAKALLASPRGMIAFYDGFVPCVLRAAPANAAVFVGVEWTRQAFATYDGLE